MLSPVDVMTMDAFIKDSRSEIMSVVWSRIKTALEELGTTPNSKSMPCQHVLDGGTNGGQYECVKCGALFESM